jgi:hypothetical protein
MVKLYVNLILSGKKSIDDVPERWREEVRKMMEENEHD